MMRITIFRTEYEVNHDSPTAALNEFFSDLSDEAFKHTWEHVADLPGGGFTFNAFVNDKLATFGQVQPFDRRRR